MSSDIKQVVGTAFVFIGQATSSFGWGLFFYAAGAALLYSGGRQAAKEAREEAAKRARAQTTSQGIKANVRGSAETHYLVFGKVRVGGVIVALGTSSSATTVNDLLHIGLAHSIAHAGGCEDIGAIWIDNEKIETSEITYGSPTDTSERSVSKAKFVYGGTSMVRFQHYRGTSTQAADTTLVTASAGASTDYRRGIAWTRFTLTKPRDTDNPEAAEEKFRNAFPRGVPEISVELSGIRCYDPRQDTTNGGSGSHRLNDKTTWAWSQNPAVVAATYSIMAVSDGGMGYSDTSIDWDSVASAANICDETATSTDSPTVTFTRYQFNGALNTSDSRETNLRKILDSMQGMRVKVGGTFKFYAGAYRSPTFDLDETYLRGSVKMSTRSPLEQLYNAVRVVHDDSSQNYRTVEAPAFTSAAYQAQDGGERLWKEETLSGVTSAHQAQYIGQIIGAQSRKQKILELPCNLKALDIEAWETGTVTLDELGIHNDVYRVVSWEWEADGPKLTLREEGSDVYDTSGLETASVAAITDPAAESPETPTGLSASGVIDGIYLSWDGPDVNTIKQIDIYRADSSSPTTFALIDSAVGYSHTDPVTNGGTYYYKLKARGKLGYLSDFSSEVSGTAASPAGAASQGNGVSVYEGYDPGGNFYKFKSAVAGRGVNISDATSSVQFSAVSSESGHLVLHSDRGSTSTALADVTDFKFALEPDTVYEVWLNGLVQTAATTTGFALGATAPSGTNLMTLNLTAPDASSSTGFNGFASGTTSVSVTTAAVPAANTTYPFVASFVIATGSESGSPSTGFVGDFQIQFATEVGGSSATLKQYSVAVLSRHTTMTPSAALTLQSPGFSSSYSSTLSEADIPPLAGTTSLTVSCKTDGTWTVVATDSLGPSGSPSPQISGNWGTPTTGGAGSDYELKYVYSGLTGSGSVSNPAQDWTDISSNRDFLFQLSRTGAGTSTSSLSVQMSVRKRGTTTPLSDGTTSLSLTVELQSI